MSYDLSYVLCLICLMYIFLYLMSYVLYVLCISSHDIMICLSCLMTYVLCLMSYESRFVIMFCVSCARGVDL